ncbi:unnamed protein product [Arctogadus glacialis]
MVRKRQEERQEGDQETLCGAPRRPPENSVRHRTRLRGLRELWAETHTITLPDQQEEKPLGRPSGLIPVPGQTAPDRGQTAPDQGQTPDEPGTSSGEETSGKTQD